MLYNKRWGRSAGWRDQTRSQETDFVNKMTSPTALVILIGCIIYFHVGVLGKSGVRKIIPDDQDSGKVNDQSDVIQTGKGGSMTLTNTITDTSSQDEQEGAGSQLKKELKELQKKISGDGQANSQSTDESGKRSELGHEMPVLEDDPGSGSTDIGATDPAGERALEAGSGETESMHRVGERMIEEGSGEAESMNRVRERMIEEGSGEAESMNRVRERMIEEGSGEAESIGRMGEGMLEAGSGEAESMPLEAGSGESSNLAGGEAEHIQVPQETSTKHSQFSESILQ